MLEFLDKLFEYYNLYENFISNNLKLFLLFFFLASTLWIAFIGIISPIIIISSLINGYYACLIAILSCVIGSTLIFIISQKIKINKFKHINKKIQIRNFSFFSYVIFRLFPGVPYLFKNLSAVIFKLNVKSFIFAAFIVDAPQIILLNIFLKQLLKSSEVLVSSKDFSEIFEMMFWPLIGVVTFLLLILIIKKKTKGYYSKNLL